MHRNETRFRTLVLPHLEAGYNLARWLMGHESDAADVLQDASLKALRHLDSLRTENAKAWWLQIVRNTAYTALKSRKPSLEIDVDIELADLTASSSESALIENASVKLVHQALDELAVAHKEILILRELEDASYEEIAEILEIPTGTVMSRLARARQALKAKLQEKGAG